MRGKQKLHLGNNCQQPERCYSLSHSTLRTHDKLVCDEQINYSGQVFRGMEPLITKLEFELKHNHSINFYSTNLGWLNINIFKLVLSPFHVSLLFKYKSGNHKISLVFLIITKK